MRDWFYHVSPSGKLYHLWQGQRSWLRDAAFLDFFFQRIQHNDTGLHLPAFPFLSRCGGERNFVAVSQGTHSPIVFTQLHPPHLLLLRYGGGGLHTPLHPHLQQGLRLDPHTGHLYHMVAPHPRAPGGPRKGQRCEWGLVSSQVASHPALLSRLHECAGGPASCPSPHCQPWCVGVCVDGRFPLAPFPTPPLPLQSSSA